MPRMFAKPIPLGLLLAFCTFIPIMVAGVRVYQIPAGILPEDSLRIAVAPLSHWLHSLAGVVFGVLGPLQFMGVLRRKFGRLHRITGRIFGVAGLFLGLSGLSLLAQVDSISTQLLDGFRGIAGGALVVAIGMGIQAARARDISRHRAWMIRSYAIGMGSGTVALVMFPIFLAKGAPITGLMSDIVFVGWWIINILLGEWVARRGQTSPTPMFAKGSLS